MSIRTWGSSAPNCLPGTGRGGGGGGCLAQQAGYYGIPRPDVSLFLDVPFAFTEKKLSEVREGDDRDYLKGERDIHEASLDLQRRVREVYRAAAAADDRLRIIDCSDARGGMDSPDAIFARIRTEIERFR